MNQIRTRLHVALLLVFLLVLANLVLRPASAAQAAQTPATTDQTDTSAAKSKKKKKTTTADDTAAADALEQKEAHKCLAR